MHTPDGVWTQRPNHPGLRRRNRVWGRKSVTTGRLEPMTMVVLWVPEHEHQLHAQLAEAPNAVPDQTPSDTPALSVGHDRQRSENRDRDVTWCVCQPRRGEHDVAKRPLAIASQQREQGLRTGIVDQFAHEFCHIISAERRSLDEQDVFDVGGEGFNDSQEALRSGHGGSPLRRTSGR